MPKILFQWEGIYQRLWGLHFWCWQVWCLQVWEYAAWWLLQGYDIMAYDITFMMMIKRMKKREMERAMLPFFGADTVKSEHIYHLRTFHLFFWEIIHTCLESLWSLGVWSSNSDLSTWIQVLVKLIGRSSMIIAICIWTTVDLVMMTSKSAGAWNCVTFKF